MKFRAAPLLILSATVLTIAIAAVPGRPVSDKKCYDIQQMEIPCPDKKRPTVIYPSFTPTATITPTSTVTPTATATPTLTPTPSPALGALPADSPPAAGGPICPPYVNSRVYGAGALLTGLVTLALARRGLFDANRLSFVGGPRTGSALPGVTQTAIPTGSGSGGIWLMVSAGLARAFGGLINAANPSPDLPSMNQNTGGVAAGSARVIGTGLTGAGAGVLGAGILGGLLGLDCISAPLVLPTGAALGLIGALAAAVLLANANNSTPLAPKDDPDNGDGELSTFEMYGVINETYADGPSGNASIYREKDLE